MPANNDTFNKLVDFFDDNNVLPDFTLPVRPLTELETEVEKAFADEVEDYIRNLPWSDITTDEIKTLVAGNIRAYAYRERINGPLNGFVNKLVMEHIELHRKLNTRLNDWRVIEVDGLPDEERDYLVTASNGDYFVAVATFENGTFLYGDVVAWRELPVPYQPQGEGKDETARNR